MNTVSYGEERPMCRDENENCFARNRRAAFVQSQ
jgi:outer membrane protein OmpA-like peptidoglycan-associated protein